MPIHLEDSDISPELAGVNSILIVPCNLCPAVTISVNDNEPFLRIFRNFLKSDPFEKYISRLQTRLKGMGIKADVFRSDIPHQWFMCMWTAGRRKKLQKEAGKYDAVLALGCDSANETVREAVITTGCKVIEGMEVTGIMNAKLNVSFTGNVSFKDCRVTAISRHRRGDGITHEMRKKHINA